MDLIDLFLSEPKRVDRHTRRLTNRDAQPEDREASARWLAENRKPRAIAGLISRFDMNLDHQLKDQAEKEALYALLVSLGPDVVLHPLESWLKHCKQFALPLRLLGELASRARAIDVALELLEAEARRDDFKAAKKKELLVWFSDVRDPRLVTAAAPLLRDFDEGVRYAAAEVLLAQPGDASVPALVAVMIDPKEESNRLRLRIADALSTRRVDVVAHGASPDRLPPGFTLRDGRLARSGA
jgi:hypothetical protein